MAKKTATIEQGALAVGGGPTKSEISEMTMLALQSSDPASAVEKLMTMRHLEQDRMAEREFNDALNRFHDECPPVVKSRTAQIATRGGGSYSYKYIELGALDRTIRPIARKHGLRWKWTTTTIDGEKQAVCVLSHVGGHREESSFPYSEESSAPISGAQKSGAAFTYAKRQSLLAVFGLSAYDSDTDGTLPHALPGTITEQQAADLETLLEEVGADRAKFFAWAGVAYVEDLPADKYQQAVRLLEKKRRP